MALLLKKWEQDEPPTEQQLRKLFEAEGLHPYAWSNGPGDTYPPHVHEFDKVLMVLKGSITWILPELGENLTTCPGDRLDLPAGTRHAARVGPGGVTCLEAYRG